MVNIEVQVDGSERVKHQGQGKILLLVQFRDSAGKIYQQHNSLPLDNVDAATGHTESIYRQDVFVVPGEYQVSVGLLITDTKEHAIMRKELQVDALRHDPLPDAWRDLPAVEFLPEDDPPDAWYLPSLNGRLKLAIDAKRPVHVDLLVNQSSTEQMPQTRLLRHGGMDLGPVIAAVKVLSAIRVSSGSVDLSMLDLERKRVSFQQTLTAELDWQKLKGSFDSANPNKIDLGSLQRRDENAQFFLAQIQKRMAAAEGAEPLHALIVLSRPMAFDKANLTPIQAAPDRNIRIYYVRYRPVQPRDTNRPSDDEFPQRRGRGTRTGRFDIPNPGGYPSDELFGLLKPIDPRLFEVNTPIEFRKALAAILNDIIRVTNNL